MYPLLDRRLCKLSIDTLFTPFGLQINNLGEKREQKSDQFENFENYSFITISKVFFLSIFDSTLSKISNGTKNA